MARLSAHLERLEISGSDACTLRCRSCNHLSPLLPKKVHQPEAYAPWLEKLRAGGCTWRVTCLTGGEPFINKRLIDLARLVKDYGQHVEIYTNAFWLKNESSIDRYDELWGLVDWLVVTRYKPYENDDRERLLGLLGQRIPVLSNVDGVVTTFHEITFSAEAKPIKMKDCVVRYCTQLRPTGVLYRCTYGMGVEVPGYFPPGVDTSDMVYDIDHDTRPLQEWYSKWPMSICAHCSIGQGVWSPHPWEEVRQPSNAKEASGT